MADARCVHDLLPGQCADCTGRDGGETAERERHRALLRLPGVVMAAFDGKCGSCGEHYPERTPIRAVPDSTPGPRKVLWAAACCLDDNGRPEEKR